MKRRGKRKHKRKRPAGQHWIGLSLLSRSSNLEWHIHIQSMAHFLHLGFSLCIAASSLYKAWIWSSLLFGLWRALHVAESWEQKKVRLTLPSRSNLFSGELGRNLPTVCLTLGARLSMEPLRARTWCLLQNETQLLWILQPPLLTRCCVFRHRDKCAQLW